MNDEIDSRISKFVDATKHDFDMASNKRLQRLQDICQLGERSDKKLMPIQHDQVVSYEYWLSQFSS